MPPSQKRKRNDRDFSNGNNYDGAGGRPSPHRPGDLPLAHNNNRGQYAQLQGPQSPQFPQQQAYGGPQNGQGGGRGRRGGRGGRGGGYGGQQNGGYDGANGGPRGGRLRDSNLTAGNNNGNETDAVLLGRAQEQAPVDQAGTPGPPPPQVPLMTTSTPAPRPTQAPPTPRAPLTPQPIEPPKPAGSYDYEVITQERISNWTSTGKDDVLRIAAEASQSEDVMVVSTIFQELVRAGIDGKLDLTDAGDCVKSILDAARQSGTNDAESLFLDTLSVLTESDVKNSRIRPIVFATGIAPEVMRERLDDALLQSIQVVRPTFNRAFIRHQTGILYRQSNYNLLREETEGYSKLLTELFTTTSDEPPTAEVVENAFENIKALVGAFDLDAGRVLDVLLDVFASLLVKHYRFFVKLLRASSWWPQDQAIDSLPASEPMLPGLPAWAEPEHSGWLLEEEDRARTAELKESRDITFWERAREIGVEAFFELGGRKILSESDVVNSLSVAESSDEVQKGRAAEANTWIRETRTLPPPGNPVAAQLLGFKLRSYASKARDAGDNLPVNLIYLSALLIKIGFVSLRDLYAHLWPEDSAMEEVKVKQTKEKEERELAKRPGGGKLNALASAGALADDTAPAAPLSRVRGTDTRATTPSSKADAAVLKSGTPAQNADKVEDDEEQLPEPSDQKVQLLRSLLCIGAIPEALYLLGRFTWLPDAFPDLPEHLHRILHHSLSKVYESCQPLQNRQGLRQSATIPDANQVGVPKGGLRLQEAPAPKTLRWAQLDKNDTGDGVDYKFYWDDWSDNVPVCQNVEDVFTLCNTLLNYSGVKIGLDPALIMKLARIGKKNLADDSSDSNKTRWIDLCKKLLCPALSLTRASPGLVNEVFDILKCFPTQTRYQVYAEWFLGQTSRLPDVANAFELVKAEARDIMKRMSKTNMKPMARALAKITCASPGIAFAVVLNQIESYENLIDVVVECGRYFTYLGYDVLNWCVMTTLGRAGRSRVTADGITTSGWLASLSVFAGRVFKRYSIMSTLPILQYVLEQLRQGNFTDLRVLRELITTMAGIAPDTDFTDAQVQAMAGGELLQAQTLRQLQDKRHENKPSAQRLMKTLIGNGLVGPMLVSIAQQRQLCIFNPDQMSLKVIGENFDDIHIVMSQFLDMIRNNLTIEEFNAVVPDVAVLMQEYGIDASVAFTIHRRSIARQIEEYDAAHKSTTKGIRRTSSSKLQAPADVEMADAAAPSGLDEAIELASATNAIIQETSDQPESEIGVKSEEAQALIVPTNPATTTQEVPWHPVLQEIIKNIQMTLSDEFTSSMSLPFFVTFWQLSLHDLMAPHKSYTDEDNRQKERIAAINADRSDVTAAAARKKEQEKKTIVEFRNRLVEEMKTHLSNYSEVRNRLESEKKHWFKDFKGHFKKLNDALLQECFLPRLLISPLDSYFSWKMLNFLHSSGTPEFRTNHFLDRLLSEKMLTNLIFHCTAREAECLGRFLSEVFGELSSWHASKATYEKRAWGTKKELPGFVMKLPKEGEPPNLLDFEDFRRLMYKWHTNLTRSLLTCLTNGEYMHIKNAIVVLRCVCRYFPIVNWMGEKLDTVVEQLAKDEKDVRPDIWVASSSLRGNLKARQKDRMLPQAFHQAKQPNRVASAAATPQPGTPTTSRKSSALNASASEFVPTNKQTANGVAPQPGEVEDGEVEDVQMKDAASAPNSTAPNKGKADIEKAKAAIQRRKSSTPATSTQQHLGQGSGSLPTPTPTPTPTPQAASAAPSRPQTSRPPSARNTPQPAATSQRPDLSRTSSRQQHDLPSRPDALSQSRGRGTQDRLSGRAGEPADRKQQELPTQARHERPGEFIQQWQGDRHGTTPRRDDSARQGTPQSRLREDAARNGNISNTGSTIDRDARGPHAGAHDGRGISNYSRDEARSRTNAGLPAASVPINPARAALIQQNESFANDRGSGATPIHTGTSRDDPMTRASGRNTPSDAGRDSYHDHARWAPGSQSNAPRSSDPGNFDPQRQASGRSPYQSYGNEQRHQNDLQPARSRPGYGAHNDLQLDSRGPDRSQGRLTQEPPRVPRHQDMSYGRLNADPSSPPRVQSVNDIPVSVERRRNNDANSVPVSASLAARAPPSGPGAYRQDRNVPAQESGTRPNGQRQQTPPSQPAIRPNSNGTNATPLGPRAAQDRRQDFNTVSNVSNVPISPVSGRGPPTGPASSHDRRQQAASRFNGRDPNVPQQNAAQPQGGRPDLIAANNNYDQGTSIRGHASRQNSQAQPQFAQPSTSQTPVIQNPQPARQPLPPQDRLVQAARQGQGMPAQRPRDEQERSDNARPQGDRPMERNPDARDANRSAQSNNPFDIQQAPGRDLRSQDIRGGRAVQPPTRGTNNARDNQAQDYAANERNSRRTRDRAINDATSFAPAQPQQAPSTSSGPNSRARGDRFDGPRDRDGSDRNDSRGRDHGGHNNRDRDNYHDTRDRGASGPGTGLSQPTAPQQHLQQQQHVHPRMAQPSQDELFQSRTAGGPSQGFGDRRTGSGGMGSGDFRGDGRDGRDGRKRGWSTQGENMADDNGKRPRRGGGR